MIGYWVFIIVCCHHFSLQVFFSTHGESGSCILPSTESVSDTPKQHENNSSESQSADSQLSLLVSLSLIVLWRLHLLKQSTTTSKSATLNPAGLHGIGMAGRANHVESWLGLIYSATKAVRVSIPAFIQIRPCMRLRVCLLLVIAFDGDND